MPIYQGSCHCGGIKFEVEAEIDHVRVCDCSVCRRRGALIHRVPEAALRLLSSWKDLSLYQWGSESAKDYFCPVCGVLPFRRPSDPTSQELERGVQPFAGWAVNIRCLDNVDIEAISVQKVNGSQIQHDF